MEDENNNEYYIRVLIAKWNIDHVLDLAVSEIRQTGFISKDTNDLWLSLKREYLRVQKNVTDSAKYRLNLFSFMSLQDGDDATNKSDNNGTSEESVLIVYRTLVDSKTWNDDEIESLERFDYLLRQQAVKKSFIENGASQAKKIFNNLWKSETKAKYAAIKNSLRDLLAGKIEADVDDVSSFNVEALNALEILASKLEQPFLHQVARDTWESVHGLSTEPSPNDSDLPREMNLTVSGATLFNAMKQLKDGKQGQPLYLGKKSLVKLRKKFAQHKKKKLQLLRALPEYFPDFQCDLESDNEAGGDQVSESSDSDGQVSFTNKRNLSLNRNSGKAEKHNSPHGKSLTKELDLSPRRSSSLQKRHVSPSSESSPNKSRRISTGKKQLYNTKRKLLLDSDGSENASTSDTSPKTAKPSPPAVILRYLTKPVGSAKKRRKWTEKEEDLLFRGVAEYGVGRWTDILQYTRLKRTNVDLKDKWRHIISKGKLKTISKRLGIKLRVDI